MSEGMRVFAQLPVETSSLPVEPRIDLQTL